MHSQSLFIARLLIVMGSMAPLFFLWLFKDPDTIVLPYFRTILASLILIPNIILCLRIIYSIKDKESSPITIMSSDNQKDHLLTYLFALLIPFYQADFSNYYGIISSFLVVLLLVFLFLHLNLHYVNILFAIFGYRVYTITPNEKLNRSADSVVLLTKRVRLNIDDRITAFRISDTVFIEFKEDR